MTLFDDKSVKQCLVFKAAELQRAADINSFK